MASRTNLYERGKLPIGTIIREIRKESGLTQAELAARLGMSRTWITSVEGGNTGIDADLLHHVAKELRTTVFVLYGRALEKARLPATHAHSDEVAAAA